METLNWRPVPLSATYSNKEDALSYPSKLIGGDNFEDLFLSINLSAFLQYSETGILSCTRKCQANT